MHKDEWARVREGNEFDDKVQASWKETEAEAGNSDVVKPEVGIIKPSGRRGRIDVYVKIGGSDDTVAIVENKATNWDGLSDETIEKRVQRHARQIWQYIEGHLGKVVAPGVIVRKRPSDPGVAGGIAKDDRRKHITTVWAEYDHLRSGQEIRLSESIFLRKRPRNKAKASDIVRDYARRGLIIVWDKDLERTVYPGITLKKRPVDRDKIARIEALYGEYGIAVVWDDETIADRRTRI